MLSFPATTVVGSHVPKTAFYRYMEVNSRMKERFVSDLESIVWSHKLAASTLNVECGSEVSEIEIFEATLKRRDCPDDLFAFIDSRMPHHLVFLQRYEGEARLMINYKQWADSEHTRFNVIETFRTPWMPADQVELRLDGGSLDRIYDNMVAQVSGIGAHRIGTLATIVSLQKQIAAAEKAVATQEKKMNRERQLDRKMQLRRTLDAKRQELEVLKNKITELKG